jgi:hypothetical protein
MYTQRPFGWWSFSIRFQFSVPVHTEREERVSVKFERRTLGTGTPLPLGQCRRRWSRAPTGQRDGVAWRRRGQDTVDTLDETCTSTECRRERGGRSEEGGARSEEGGARSEERGARSQEPGARSLGSTSPCGARRPVALTDSSCRALPDDNHSNRQNNFTVAFPTASKQKQFSILSSNSTRGTSVAQYSSFET